MKLRVVLWFIAWLLSGVANAAPLVNLNVYVHNESGDPIEGALVQGFFFQDQVIDNTFAASHHGITNKEGMAELSGHEEIYVDLEVTKKGSYKSKKRVNVRPGRSREIDILLRDIRKPIAMYARKIKLQIPERSREYGFDFLKGDLVAPGHNGSHADMRIQFDRNLIDENYSSQMMNIRFENPTDGITEMLLNEEWASSEFKSAYIAPAEGYVNKITIENDRSSSGYRKKNMNTPFYIRIRSSADKDGEINDAYYCKVWPGFKLLGVRLKRPLLEMTYYCNPTNNDRNIEFDPGKNLFKNR